MVLTTTKVCVRDGQNLTASGNGITTRPGDLTKRSERHRASPLKLYRVLGEQRNQRLYEMTAGYGLGQSSGTRSPRSGHASFAGQRGREEGGPFHPYEWHAPYEPPRGSRFETGVTRGQNPVRKPAPRGSGIHRGALLLATRARYRAHKKRVAMVIWMLALLMVGAGIFDRLDAALNRPQLTTLEHRQS